MITFNYSEFFANIIANALLKVQDGAVDVASGTLRKAQGHLNTVSKKGFARASSFISNAVSNVIAKASSYTTENNEGELSVDDSNPTGNLDWTASNKDYGDYEDYDEGWFSSIIGF